MITFQVGLVHQMRMRKQYKLKKFQGLQEEAEVYWPRKLDDATYACNPSGELDGCDLLDGNSTPYADSSDEDESFEEGTSDQVIRKEDKFPKFDRKSETPTFALGMKFSGKKEFKDPKPYPSNRSIVASKKGWCCHHTTTKSRNPQPVQCDQISFML